MTGNPGTRAPGGMGTDGKNDLIEIDTSLKFVNTESPSKMMRLYFFRWFHVGLYFLLVSSGNFFYQNALRTETWEKGLLSSLFHEGI